MMDSQWEQGAEDAILGGPPRRQNEEYLEGYDYMDSYYDYPEPPGYPPYPVPEPECIEEDER
jgi:hypothetical protein